MLIPNLVTKMEVGSQCLKSRKFRTFLSGGSRSRRKEDGS